MAGDASVEAVLVMPSGNSVFFDIDSAETHETFKYAGPADRLIQVSASAFESAIDSAFELAQIVKSRMVSQGRNAQFASAELTFGLCLKADADVKIVSIGGECTMQLTVRWESE